jgi:hypothetical protein
MAMSETALGCQAISGQPPDHLQGVIVTTAELPGGPGWFPLRIL